MVSSLWARQLSCVGETNHTTDKHILYYTYHTYTHTPNVINGWGWKNETGYRVGTVWEGTSTRWVGTIWEGTGSMWVGTVLEETVWGVRMGPWKQYEELDKPNQYHARNVDAMTTKVNIYSWGGWRMKGQGCEENKNSYSKPAGRPEFYTPRILRTVKICKHRACETSRRDHPCNCARYERPSPLCQIWETTPIVPDMRDHTHCARCVQLSMQPCIRQVPNQPRHAV